MLIYSMGTSVDGFIADREGGFAWTTPSDEQFRFHIALTRELGVYLCGRRLYETMLPWETDPSMRDNALGHVRRRLVRDSTRHQDIALDLIETRTFGSRVVYERSRRIRDQSD